MDWLLTRPLAGSLAGLDLLVVAGAVGLLFVIAYLAGRREADTRDFFLGRRGVPTVVASLSFVATEVSAITIVSVPAAAFHENWNYLQFFVGSALARVFVAFLFLPAFYRHDCTSIYEFLRHRFDAETQYAGSVFFFLTRLVASGLRLYIACAAVGVILGWSLEATLLLFTIVSIALIAFGGIKAVVWNGAYSAAVFYVSGLAVAGWLVAHVSGGLGEVWRVAGPAGKLQVFNFTWGFNEPTSFWAGMFNAFFIGLAIFGTDQELVQRLLTVRTRRASQKAIVYTILAALPMLLVYLSVGTLLYVFYGQNPQLPQPEEYKHIYSRFTERVLPAGLSGLVLATVILASIDSPLSSLSSSFVSDIYRPLVRRGASERHYLWVGRAGVVAFGVVLGLIALACRPVQDVLWFAFEIVSITGSSILGVFLLGVLTPWGNYRHNVVAMVLNSLAMLALLLLSHAKVIALAWSWLIVIGTLLTFGLGLLLGPVLNGWTRAPSGGQGTDRPAA